MFAGGIISLENSKIGGYILAIGAICLIVQGTEVTKEPKKSETKEEEKPVTKIMGEDLGPNTKYRIEGNQVLLLDTEGNVVATMPVGNARRLIGNNKNNMRK